MIFKAKVGNKDIYIEITASNIVRLLRVADEECMKNNFTILEIRNSKNQLIDIDKYRRAKQETDLGYMKKSTIAKCYRSIQQAMWYKYDEEEYAKIKIELKKIKDTSETLEELKERLTEYIKSLED